MKIRTTIVFAAALAALSVFAFTGCASTTATPPNDSQQMIANAVEDAIAIGLVPVLTRNPGYLAAATGVANALGAFGGTTITPDDVSAFLVRTRLTLDDQRVVAGIVNAAWATFEKRYAQRVSGVVRPDVKLFLAAVANGIKSAVAATPKPMAMESCGVLSRPLFGACGVPAIGRV